MIKSYVIDTNVLLQDPDAIFNFQENNVIIPIGVIEELDRFKKENNELGRNARQVSRHLDILRLKGDLRDGVCLDNNGKIFVSYNGNLNSFYKEDNVDLHVIHIAQEAIKKNPNSPCVIVTRDVNIRIRANALGLAAEDYEHNKIDEIDNGHSDIECQVDLIDCLSSEGEIDLSLLGLKNNIYPNHYLNLKNDSKKRSLLAKINFDCTKAITINAVPNQLGLRPKNREQHFVIDALLDPSVFMVSVSGRAGCGKTLLASAVGYYLTVAKNHYDKMLISRPVYPMGKDLGFLPGDINEKLEPWMQPVYDAFDVIASMRSKNKGKNNSSPDGKKMVLSSGLVKVEPLTYIRGRSIHNGFLLVDEAQNLTPLEIKTIVTRAGDGTKIVFTGDIEQIDNPYMDKYSNGLSVVIESFKDSQIASHIIMSKGVRSPLAEEASIRL